MAKQQEYQKLNTYLKIVVLSFFFIAICAFYPRLPIKTFGSEMDAQATPRKRKTPLKPTPTPPDTKYSNFSHQTHLGLKLACDACHKVPTANWDKVRSKESAFPDVTDYPKHDSCVNCHRSQFFSGKPPAICSNCHTNPSPNDSSRHPFANPREIFDSSPKGKNEASAFEISFPHDKHIEIVSRTENPFELNRNGVSFVNAGLKRAEESCVVCHQTYKPQDKSDDEFMTPPPKDLGDAFWLKKGTFKTVPIGHTTCFTCHSTETGILPAPTDCGTCHKLKQPIPTADFDAKLAEQIGVTDKIILSQWKRRDSSGKFRHEWFSHADLSCAICHNVVAINTTDPKTKKVAISSCNNCHITATLDDGGVLNTEIEARKKDVKSECVKCHLTYGKSAIPDSHLKAVSELAKGN